MNTHFKQTFFHKYFNFCHHWVIIHTWGDIEALPIVTFTFLHIKIWPRWRPRSSRCAYGLFVCFNKGNMISVAEHVFAEYVQTIHVQFSVDSEHFLVVKTYPEQDSSTWCLHMFHIRYVLFISFRGPRMSGSPGETIPSLLTLPGFLLKVLSL